MTVSVKAALPCTTEVELKLRIVGLAGFTVKVAAEEVFPSVVTVTLAVPAVAIRLAGTVAVNCVALT